MTDKLITYNSDHETIIKCVIMIQTADK